MFHKTRNNLFLVKPFLFTWTWTADTQCHKLPAAILENDTASILSLHPSRKMLAEDMPAVQMQSEQQQTRTACQLVNRADSQTIIFISAGQINQN